MFKSHKNEETRLSPSQAPAPVTASINSRFPGSQIDSITKETENGNVIYDVELKSNGVKNEMDIKEDGTYINFEKEIDASLEDNPDNNH